jgi:CHAT domain-containing protein
MISFRFRDLRKGKCLTDEDLYRYVSGDGKTETLSRVEAHFVTCPECRQNLASLIEILGPESGQQEVAAEPSRLELERTLELIRSTSRKEESAEHHLSYRLRWPIAAAAAIGFTVFSLLGFKHLYEKNKSEAFLNQARAMLEQSYTGTSPGNLRLDLPFQSTASNRKGPDTDNLRPAENLFFQALAVRENMTEARLGLGYIYLAESKYLRAKDEFQTVLKSQKADIRGLIGRGVTQYELAIQGADPLQRNELLKSALEDFDAVLRIHPESAEAQYNKIWALYESGLQKESLRQIDAYLTRDPNSIWARKLKGLAIRIQATAENAVDAMVEKAACERDRSTLLELAKQVPHLMPGAIWNAMRRSLLPDQKSVSNKTPDSEDRQWAATLLEAGYSESTGDHSFGDLINFYVGLSPPEKEIKRALDQEFQSVVQLYQAGSFDLALHRSKSLESRFLNIKDYWPLLNLYHLRGNCLHTGKADFRSAESEYRKMNRMAERLHAPFFRAKALYSLAMILGEQREFDRGLVYANLTRDLATEYKLALMQVSACAALGNQYQLLGQFEQALQEYTAALSLAYPMLGGVNIIKILEETGSIMGQLGRIKQAEAYFQLAIQQEDNLSRDGALRKIPPPSLRHLNLLSRQGELALRTGDLSDAESFFRKSLDSCLPEMHELKARNWIGLTEISLRRKQIGEAESMLKPAIAATVSGQYPEIEWQTKFMKGKILQETGFHQEALLNFRESVRSLERLRQLVDLSELRQSFLIDRFDPFKAVISLLSQSPGAEQELLNFMDRAKASTLKEGLAHLNSDDESRGNFSFGKETGFTSVEYFFAKDRMLILATGNGDIRVFAQNVAVDSMQRKVSEFRECIRKNDSPKFLNLARQLYDQLISPVEAFLAHHPSETLIVMPDGPLHLLPFAGLQDSAGRFLIEKTPVAYAPSRSIFRHCLSLGRKTSTDRNGLLLIDGSGGLPNAQQELAYLSSLYGKNAFMLSAGDMPMSIPLLERTSIFHFSGHAAVRQGRPVLILQRLPKEIILDCSTIRSWKMPKSRLINLAGCSTGIGPVADGEAPWGLIPAFLDAGTSAVVASLMDVDDASARTINCRFYDQLQKGSGIARALQIAQIALLQSVRSGADVKPQSWIPFVLLGNPQ